MKRLLVCILLITCLLSGCSPTHLSYEVIERRVDFDVLYMKDTKVMYYRGTYTLTPYYSENGKLCRYIDGKIVEIED